MIIYFSVKNFRSIRDKITLNFRASAQSELAEYYIYEFPELKLKLLKMAMIFGKNASGKTNILRALDFLRDFIIHKAADKTKPTGVQPFALDKDKNSEFEIKFVYENIIYLYKLILNQNLILSEQLYYWPNGVKTRIFTRDYNFEEKNYKYNWSGAKASKALIENLILTVQSQSILTSLKQYEYSGPMQQAYNWFNKTLAPIVKPDTKLVIWNIENFWYNEKFKDFYISQMQKADFIINGINVKKEEVAFAKIPFVILEDTIRNKNTKLPDKMEQISIILSHKVSDGEFSLELKEQSEGTIRFLELCGLLCWIQQNNKVIPIDEIERSMHEDLITYFIETYLSFAQASQIIFTSQNSTILDMKEIIRRDTIWITDRLENGGTELTRLTDYPVKKEHSIGNLYRKGLIGGKPDTGIIKWSINNE
ncbi:MAG TPA: ATP-binding protein [Candidatus Cloacimonadota bacterium]|nr:ATP-binding protein [Candidatus Cloacimonadota bacterium]HQL15077.1 ATP-binding protein [Candidatus Cloacimonadota bacterium]